ncbi:MAG: polynucleotide adenylyltransferase PcnB [Acidobacteria bacterium]|nr:polynucleotide adenylyltransferase PcnB [Acidobacteriota bacterium]
MGPPVILPRAEHAISRKQIDPDALRVLYRLQQHNYLAYLVGGSVRDLLLGRRPKDFDIGTSAHPYQVKRLFRNCWIIGRRFRLAHIRYGTKTIEVATFRRQLSADELAALDSRPPSPGIPVDGHHRGGHERLLHRDNTFGTPEEDAFRRDFTVNALFYDIASLSIIDYTGGLRDLKARVVRCIGDPTERFQDDPVRMLRAVAMAARLGFSIDPPIDAAIAAQRGEIGRSAPSRLIEEFYKLLRAGASERTFRMLAERRLLDPIAHQLQEGCGDALWRSLSALDAHRKRFEGTPDTLTNAVLLGSLLVPLGPGTSGPLGPPVQHGELRKERAPSLGILPLARRDVERLGQILGLQRRLVDMNLSPRARRALVHRGPFREALTWLEIHGQAPQVLEHWRGFVEAAGTFEAETEEAGSPLPPRRRRRRRRRRPSDHGPRRHGDTEKH